MAYELFDSLAEENRQYWEYQKATMCDACNTNGVWAYYGNSLLWTICLHCDRMCTTNEESEDISAEDLAFFLLVMEGT